MKNKILLTAITSLFVSFGISTAGPIDPKSVPADVDYYLHLNLDRIDEGKIGEWMSEFSDTMLFKADEESCLRFFTDEADNVSGGVTIYGNGESPEDSIVHVSGLTKKAALIAEIEQSRGHKSSSKDGLTIHSWNEKLKGEGISVYGAFLDDGTMIASQSEGSLMSAINFRNNDGKGIGLPANSNSAILIKANLEKLSKHAESQLVRSAKSIESAMDIAADGTLNGAVIVENSDAAGAQQMMQMVQMMQGMIAFGAMATESEQWNPVDAVKVKRAGNSVEIDFSVPIGELEKLKKMQPLGE